ncbi:hypothetical protein VNO77_20281 [Canavalia gladiata]|uniref:Uncharacterized protein n=1 Tax=Canavalia gladiata TaxID=3824 RepID=A0AAN9QQE3_CANGL
MHINKGKSNSAGIFFENLGRKALGGPLIQWGSSSIHWRRGRELFPGEPSSSKSKSFLKLRPLSLARHQRPSLKFQVFNTLFLSLRAYASDLNRPFSIFTRSDEGEPPLILLRNVTAFWTLTRISLGQQEARPLPPSCSGDERRSNEVNELDLGCTNMFGQGLRLRRLR